MTLPADTRLARPRTAAESDISLMVEGFGKIVRWSLVEDRYVVVNHLHPSVTRLR